MYALPHTLIYYITNACATGDAVSLNEYDCFFVLFLFIIILDFNYFACICCCYCWFRRHSPPIPYQKKSMLAAADSSQKPSNKKMYDSNYIHKANCTSCAFVFCQSLSFPPFHSLSTYIFSNCIEWLGTSDKHAHAHTPTRSHGKKFSILRVFWQEPFGDTTIQLVFSN